MQVSAKQYIQNKVMGRPKRMLTYTDLPVSGNSCPADLILYLILSVHSVNMPDKNSIGIQKNAQTVKVTFSPLFTVA